MIADKMSAAPRPPQAASLEQFELPVGPPEPASLPTSPEEIAALVRRAAALEARLASVTAHFRQRDAATERGDGHTTLSDSLKAAGRWLDGLWCGAPVPVASAPPAPDLDRDTGAECPRHDR